MGALQEGRWEGSRRARDAKHVVMLTGDNPASARRIGRLVGISDIRAVSAVYNFLYPLLNLTS